MVKMDIEGDEWKSFQQMFTENSLRNVKQLAYEIHLYQKVDMFSILMKLEKLGFRKFMIHHNPVCSFCFELYYINTNFIMLE